MRKIKKPSRKIKKYEEAGQLDKLNLRLGSVTSAVNLAGDLKNTISNWGDSTKSEKASGVFNSAGDAFGTMKSVPGLGMIAGIGEGVLKGVGAIAGMFPGKDGKAKAREEANQQVRLDRYNSGTLFSKHGGTLPPSSEYKIMPSAKSGRKAPITKLTEDMDIIGNDATFSHSSQDDIPTDTNNDGQEDLRMEGGEIILKNKDGQYMLNKKIAKPFSKKASILAKGDNISKKTLEHLKSNAIKENDANLAFKGMFDRTSAFGGMITKGKGYTNGEGGNIKKETVNLSPKNYQKLAKDKPVMTPQDFQKYLSDTGRVNIKTYQVGPVDKGAQVKKYGGKIKKYDLAGNTGGPYRTDNPMVTEDYTPTSVPERKINPFVAPEEGYSPYFSAYKFPPGDNIQMNKIEPTAIPTNTSNTMYSVATPKISKAAKKGLPPMKIPSNPSNRERITGGEGIAGVGAMLGTGLKALALKRNKSLPFKLSDISSNLGESYSKALSGLDFGENEAVKDIQGKTNQALDTTSYPSYQSRLANARNVLKGQASNIAQTRGHFAGVRANMRGQFASDLARQTSQNRTVENQVNQQEIDAKTENWQNIAQDLTNNSFNMGYLANARKYRQDLNRDYEWDGSTYKVKRTSLGGKIKKPKKIK